MDQRRGWLSIEVAADPWLWPVTQDEQLYFSSADSEGAERSSGFATIFSTPASKKGYNPAQG
jgi:hypothetical protein